MNLKIKVKYYEVICREIIGNSVVERVDICIEKPKYKLGVVIKALPNDFIVDSVVKKNKEIFVDNATIINAIKMEDTKDE